MDTHPPSEPWRRVFLPAWDIVGILLAFSVAYMLRMETHDPSAIFTGLLAGFVIINIACLYLFDLYELNAHTRTAKKALQAVGAVAAATCVNIVLAYLLGAVEFSGFIGRGVLIGAQLLFAVWAAGFRHWLQLWLRQATQNSRFLVLGSEEYLRPFLKDLLQSRLAGSFSLLTPHGSPLTDLAELNASAARYSSGQPILTLHHGGSWSDLERLTHENWTGIIVGGGHQLSEELVEILMQMRLSGVRIADLTDFYEQTWFKVPVYYLERSWFAMAQGFQLLHNPVGLKLKRIFDIAGASLLLALTAPILALIAIAIKLESRGPLIFKQTRVGEGGRHFTVFKLRSMRKDAEKNGAVWASVGDARVTRVGAFIRATRIDELPQLFNVLRGEMSFIGPRPERPEFTGQLEEQIPFYNLRHLLRPGVTGWAQVMYPYGASVEDARQKLQYELYYIKNYSLALDALIVLKTIRVVLFGQGR